MPENQRGSQRQAQREPNIFVVCQQPIVKPPTCSTQPRHQFASGEHRHDDNDRHNNQCDTERIFQRREHERPIATGQQFEFFWIDDIGDMRQRQRKTVHKTAVGHRDTSLLGEN